MASAILPLTILFSIQILLYARQQEEACALETGDAACASPSDHDLTTLLQSNIQHPGAHIVHTSGSGTGRTPQLSTERKQFPHDRTSVGQVSWQVTAAMWGAFLASAAYCIMLAGVDQKINVHNRRIVFFILLSITIRCIDYMLILPTVYDLTSEANGSSGFSGLVIAGYYGSVPLGILLLQVPPLQGMSFRHLTIIALVTYPLASGIYIASASVPRGPLSLVLMLSSRCISGMAEGVLSTVHHSTLARISSSTQVFLSYTLAETGGNAMGPLMASSCLQGLYSRFGFIDKNVFPSVVMCLIHGCMVLLAVLMLRNPDAGDEKEEQEEEEEDVTVSGNSTSIILSAVVVASMYAICGGLESATSLVLEVQFGWSTDTIGYAIAICIVCTLPVIMVSQYATSCVSDVVIQQSGLVVVCIMTTFLLPQTCELLHFIMTLPMLSLPSSRAFLILVSDAFVYSFASLVTGMAEARTYALAGPQHFDSVAQFLTATGALTVLAVEPLARVLSEKSIVPYASMQICLGLLACLANIAQTALLPGLTGDAQKLDSFEETLRS